MPRPKDVVMAKSIYDENELLPEALVINKQPDLKQSLINPDMDRSNNRSHDTNNHNDDCCDNDTLLLCCCICYIFGN